MAQKVVPEIDVTHANYPVQLTLKDIPAFQIELIIVVLSALFFSEIFSLVKPIF